MTAVHDNAGNTFASKTHISLNVKDIDGSVAFYEGFFGVPAHKRRPGYANFDVANPSLKLALQEAPITVGAGTLSHLGIQVATRDDFSRYPLPFLGKNDHANNLTSV